MSDQPPARKVTWTTLRCLKCGHEWAERLEMPMVVEAYIDRLDAWGKRCPVCGNKRRKGSKNAIDLLTGPAHARVLRERGIEE